MLLLLSLFDLLTEENSSPIHDTACKYSALRSRQNIDCKLHHSAFSLAVLNRGRIIEFHQHGPRCLRYNRSAEASTKTEANAMKGWMWVSGEMSDRCAAAWRAGHMGWLP